MTQGQNHTSEAAALEVRNVSKTFVSAKVLDDVSLTVGRGEVHALLGENGSGKSTLIRILAGYHQPDPGGEIEIEGEAHQLGNPGATHRAGLRFVHQSVAVIDELNAIENLALEDGFSSPYNIGWRHQEQRAIELLAAVGVEMDVHRPLGECRPVERSAVAIARALRSDDGAIPLLVLDEPTALLPDADVRRLFSLVGRLRAGGVGIMYVSHRLDEVFEIADRVTVLRDGRSQGTVPVKELDRDSLVELIVGRAVEEQRRSTTVPDFADDAQPTVAVSDLSAGGISNLNFEVRPGEIVGFAGIGGSGREDIAKALVGGIPVSRGTVAVEGEVLAPLDPGNARSHGLVLGLSNTQRGSAVKQFSVRENTALLAMPKYSFSETVGRGRERRETATWIDKLSISPADEDHEYDLLSGGNQQKVIFARCLNPAPVAIVLDDPTAGVDVGARAQIYALIKEQAVKGLATIICSTDLEDIVTICHRALVVRDGEVVAELTADAIDESTLLSEASISSRNARDGVL